MSAVAQLALPVEAKLPVDPRELVDLDLPPIDRGRLFVAVDLDSWQIACVEEAIRAIKAGVYSARAGEVTADVAAHLRREREQLEALGRPARDGGGR